MANRVITAAVSGESIKLSNKIAGASGSVNAVSLSFTFDGTWDGTTKKVYFYDANEGNPVVTVLTTNLLVGGAYVVPIPAEPLAYAGEMTLTVRGVELGADGETAERIILSATTTMKVLNAVTPSSDVAPVEPTATQTEQLQAQIDDILGDVADIPDSVAACATSATAAAGSASSAAESATNAATSETNASTSASGAASSASAASGSASAASASETNAGNSAASATSSASAAATSASNAATSESNALSYKNTAVSAANTAQTKASEAAQSASGAAAAKTAAETAQAAASTSASTASAKATLAESWAVGGTSSRTGEDANNAHYWSIVAQGAAAGGVSTFNGRSGAVVPASGDYTAAQVGADPTGTAASAISTHNGAADAHASLLAGKSDTSHTHDGRYYTETETDTLLAGKSNTGHTHDDRYYTEDEADTLLAGKAASSHNHSASNITSGTLSIARGGTGAASAAAARTALGAQATLTAGENITISGSTISATGGILPRIIATAPTGSTVTCSKDSTTLTATEASGTWTFNVPDYGTWTVTATLSGRTATESVVVDQVKIYTTSIAYLDDTFSANTWAKIIGACQSGSVPAAWVVGNQKTMTINSASYTVTIIGKNHDTYSSDGVTKAPLTFQLQDCYGTKYQMNSSNTNSGGWTSCAMRGTRLPAILALMPSEVQAGIKQVNKLSSAGSQSSTINTTADKLFLLSEIEIFGSITHSKSGEGSQYAYYSAGNSKVKNFSGSAAYWWERSPYGSDSTYFCGVNGPGDAATDFASYSYGVAFGFCF